MRVNVRIICATNTDLQEAIQAKRFREDLYYRISAFPIMLPPLRERRSDILLLAESFLNAPTSVRESESARISRAAMEAMIAYPWPGNIREIESMIERAVILPMAIRSILAIFRSRPAIWRSSGRTANLRRYAGILRSIRNRTVLPLEEVKRIVVHHALSACRGNISEAAQKLDISRSTMYRFLEIYQHRDQERTRAPAGRGSRHCRSSDGSIAAPRQKLKQESTRLEGAFLLFPNLFLMREIRNFNICWYIPNFDIIYEMVSSPTPNAGPA